jgi:hypothetical protein
MSNAWILAPIVFTKPKDLKEPVNLVGFHLNLYLRRYFYWVSFIGSFISL